MGVDRKKTTLESAPVRKVDDSEQVGRIIKALLFKGGKSNAKD